MGRFLNFFKPFARFLPEVKAPERRVSFGEKLFWTAIVLVLYLIMSEIPLYGLPVGQRLSDPLVYLRVIFASRRGTLTELGIGPIVTAGLILQLLAGSGIIGIDLSKPEDRAVFTAANKFSAILMTVFEAAAYIVGGAYGKLNPNTAFIIGLQLVFTGIILILLDELVQKKWGIGSGISLFIAAGVAQTIWWMSLNPIPMEKGYVGALLAFAQAIINGEYTKGWWAILHRPDMPDMLGFLATIAVFLIVIYFEGMRVEVPIAHAKFRGYRGTFPLKLLYVSNIPVILAATLFTDIYFITQILWSNFNRDNTNFWYNLLGMFNTQSSSAEPIGGLVYYITPPRSLDAVMNSPVRALVYAVVFISICVVFSMTWIEVGGLDSKTVAKQLVDAGMQIPGFRRSGKPIQSIFDRYIPSVTFLGGLTVGAVSTLADFLGVFGSGMGVLLTVGILYQYYQLLVQEQVVDMYPGVRRFLGE